MVRLHFFDFAVQRGVIDSLVDDALDDIQSGVSIKKQGKVDGTYLYGARVMRIQQKNGDLIGNLNIRFVNLTCAVVQGKQEWDVETFVATFEKVELQKLKGLQSGKIPLLLL